jgi:hypothetical protein
MDKHMFEYKGGLAPAWDNSEHWSNKMFFVRSPQEIIDDEEFFETKKFKVSNEQPWVEFTFNPKSFKTGRLDYFRLPKFADSVEMDLYKQTLREAFLIAKWNYGIDVIGPLGHTLTSKPDYRYTPHSSSWRRYLGNITGYPGEYWRNLSGVSDYVKLGVFHVTQFEVEVWDNTGRGMRGEVQPARIYPRRQQHTKDISRNRINRQDWELAVSGGSGRPSGEGPALFGYDKFQDRNRFIFHIYWEPGTESIDELTSYGMTKYVPDTQYFWPSRIHQVSFAKHWGDPIYGSFRKGGQDDGTIRDNGIYFYHEGWGLGAGNFYGAYKGKFNGVPEGFGGLTVIPEFLDTKHQTYEHDADHILVGGVPYLIHNVGPLWSFFSLPSMFKTTDVDDLIGIPIRGVGKENA